MCVGIGSITETIEQMPAHMAMGAGAGAMAASLLESSAISASTGALVGATSGLVGSLLLAATFYVITVCGDQKKLSPEVAAVILVAVVVFSFIGVTPVLLALSGIPITFKSAMAFSILEIVCGLGIKLSLGLIMMLAQGIFCPTRQANPTP